MLITEFCCLYMTKMRRIPFFDPHRTHQDQVPESTPTTVQQMAPTTTEFRVTPDLQRELSSEWTNNHPKIKEPPTTGLRGPERHPDECCIADRKVSLIMFSLSFLFSFLNGTVWRTYVRRFLTPRVYDSKTLFPNMNPLLIYTSGQ